MSRTRSPLRAVLLSAVTLTAPSSANAIEATFTEVAREFVNGVGSLNVDVPVALSDNGRVVFTSQTIPTLAEGMFAWQSGTLTPINLVPGGYTEVNSLAVNSAGEVAFVARREAGVTDFRGVYRTSAAAGPITTLREETIGAGPPEPAPRFVALSENGTVAYSTIVSAAGAIYRGPIDGAQAVLRSGSGTFFNTQRLDVNDAGQVAVQMEHTSPVMGLSRGILVFDTPEQPLTSNDTAIEQTTVGQQPMPAINNLGQVAFSLDSTVTMTFYDPPNVFGGTVLDTITLTPGVYVTTPQGYGLLPRTFTKIADTSGPYSGFGDRVVINDDGLVLFEATLDGGGGFGIFAGPDPVADKVIMTGETIGSTFVSHLVLGELNNANQFTFVTSDFGSTDRQVWLATVPEPAGAVAALGAGALMTIGRRRRRPPIG